MLLLVCLCSLAWGLRVDLVQNRADAALKPPLVQQGELLLEPTLEAPAAVHDHDLSFPASASLSQAAHRRVTIWPVPATDSSGATGDDASSGGAGSDSILVSTGFSTAHQAQQEGFSLFQASETPAGNDTVDTVLEAVNARLEAIDAAATELLENITERNATFAGHSNPVKEPLTDRDVFALDSAEIDKMSVAAVALSSGNDSAFGNVSGYVSPLLLANRADMTRISSDNSTWIQSHGVNIASVTSPLSTMHSSLDSRNPGAFLGSPRSAVEFPLPALARTILPSLVNSTIQSEQMLARSTFSLHDKEAQQTHFVEHPTHTSRSTLANSTRRFATIVLALGALLLALVVTLLPPNFSCSSNSKASAWRRVISLSVTRKADLGCFLPQPQVHDCTVPRPIAIAHVVRLEATVLGPIEGPALVSPLARRPCVLYSSAATRSLHEAPRLSLPVAFAAWRLNFSVVLRGSEERVEVRGEDVCLHDLCEGLCEARRMLGDAPGHWREFVASHGGESALLASDEVLEFQECALIVGVMVTIVGELCCNEVGKLSLTPFHGGTAGWRTSWERSGLPSERITISDDPELLQSPSQTATCWRSAGLFRLAALGD